MGEEVEKCPSFQRRVAAWMVACFGEEISADRVERNHRFLEEAMELVQALGCTREEAIQLVDYVFARPIGEPSQEVGGVEVTLAALCNAAGLDKADAAETELSRIWGAIEKIRAKQAAKPKHSPLPASVSPDPAATMKDVREGLNKITECERARRAGGPAPEDLEALDDALSEAVSVAAALLAKLEGK